MSRILALDHGAARCGVAVTDPSGTISIPLDPVERPDSRKGLARLVGICEEQQVSLVVIGHPLPLSGGESDQSLAARDFADRLGRRLAGVECRLFDERLTTVEADRRGGSASLDSRAAAVLLERWLEAGQGSAS